MILRAIYDAEKEFRFSHEPSIDDVVYGDKSTFSNDRKLSSVFLLSSGL